MNVASIRLDNMQRVIPGVILLLVKLTGTSLFVVFIPQIFPRGNISFVPENISFVPENYTVSGPQTTESISEVTIVYTTEAATTTTATAQPWKWQRYRGSYYWFSGDLHMWTIGRTECKKRGSDLVKINDMNELEFIRNKTKMAYYFIGLTYDGNKWLWNDDTEIRRDLFAMKPYENGKDCVATRAGEVVSVSCYQENRWICEKNG